MTRAQRVIRIARLLSVWASRFRARSGRSYFLSLSAFAMTDTDEKLIVALAMIGLSRIPNHGYSTPAATGTPTAL